jgi:hypothetical protein
MVRSGSGSFGGAVKIASSFFGSMASPLLTLPSLYERFFISPDKSSTESSVCIK